MRKVTKFAVVHGSLKEVVTAKVLFGEVHATLEYRATPTPSRKRIDKEQRRQQCEHLRELKEFALETNPLLYMKLFGQKKIKISM